MNKTLIVKAVCKNLTSFAVSSATSNVLKTNMPKSSNPAVNAALWTSAFAGSWFVSGTIMKPVNEQIDSEIDKLAEIFSSNK